MKRLLTLILTISLVALLAACGGNKDESDNAGDSNDKTDTSKLTVGASNVPHAEILEEAAPLLADKGIELDIVTFQDYVLPNEALDTKDLDANYFQHIPYLEGQIADHGFDFEIAGNVHIEPMGIYSHDYTDINDVKDGALVIMSNSTADHGRVLTMLEEAGVIELDPAVEKVKATPEDIVENPKNLKFKFDFEPALLPKIYNNKEGDLVAINSNYALDADLNPLEDAIVLEEFDSPYVNIVVTRAGDESRDDIKTLIDVLQSKEIQDFILEKYDGAVVPAK